MNESQFEVVVAQDTNAEAGVKRSWHAPQARVVAVPSVTATTTAIGSGDGVTGCHS